MREQHHAKSKLLYAAHVVRLRRPVTRTSFEERNFYDPLKRFCEKSNWEISRFDFMDAGRKHGQQRMSEMLWETVRKRNHDISFPFSSIQNTIHWRTCSDESVSRRTRRL